MNFLQLSRKITALFIITVFSATNLFAPIPAAHAAQEILPFPPLLFRMPEALGSVTDIVEAPQSSGTFIHIQTAHGQYEAQKNIQAILEHLNQNYGTKVLFLEGASHKLQPELFRFFPQDRELNSKILDALIQNAQLTGAESFLVEGSNDLEGWGIENSEAYKRNRELFKKVILHKDASEAFLNSFYIELEKAASSRIGRGLRNFLRAQKAYERETLSLEQWLRHLKKQSAVLLDLDFEQIKNQKPWPILVRYFRLEKIGKGIKKAEVEKEKERFLKELKEFKTSPDLVKAVGESLTEKRGQAHYPVPVPFSIRFVFETLLDKLPNDFSFRPYPNLRLFIQQQILTEELLGEKFYEEAGRLTDQLLEALAKTSEEKKILARFKDYQLQKKLLNLELSREEYKKYFLKGTVPFRTVPHQEALRFYQGATEREKWMIENAVQRMRGLKQNQSVLITGGFHTSGLKQMILDSGFSYVQITPRIHEISKGAQKLYLQALTGQSLVEHSKIEPPLRLDIAQFKDFDSSFVKETGQTILQLANRVVLSERPQKKDELLSFVRHSELARLFRNLQVRSEVRSDDAERERAEWERKMKGIMNPLESFPAVLLDHQENAEERENAAARIRDAAEGASFIFSGQADPEDEQLVITAYEKLILQLTRVYSELTPIMDDENKHVRSKGVTAVGQVEEALETGLSAFLAALQSQNPQVRTKSIMVLGMIAGTLEKQIARLTDHRWSVIRIMRMSQTVSEQLNLELYRASDEKLSPIIGKLLKRFSDMNRLALSQAAIPVVEIKSTLIEKIDGEAESYRLIRDESTLLFVLEEILRINGINYTDPLVPSSQFSEIHVDGRAVPLTADYILKKATTIQVVFVQPRSEVRNQLVEKQHQLFRAFQGKRIRHIFMDYDGNYADARRRPSRHILELTHELIRRGIAIDFVSSGRGEYLKEMLEGSFTPETKNKVLIAAEAGGDVLTLDAQGRFQRDLARSLQVPDNEKRLVVDAVEFTLGQFLTEKSLSIPLSKQTPEPEEPHFNLRVRNAGTALTISNDMTLQPYLAELGARVKDEIERLWIGGHFHTKPLSTISNVAVDVTFAEGGKQGWVENRMKELGLAPGEVLVSGDSAFEGGGDEPMFRVPGVLKVYSGPSRTDLPDSGPIFHTPTEGPEGVEDTLELLLEAVKAGRSELRYNEQKLAMSLDTVIHEIFRHYRRDRKMRHQNVNLFPKTYALEITDTGDIHILDTEDTTAPLVSLPFKKPHIYFTHVMQVKAVHIKSISIQFEEDMNLASQSNLEERLKTFLVNYFEAWSHADFVKLHSLVVLPHRYAEQDDGKIYIPPARKPSRHYVTLSRSELRAKAVPSRKTFGFTRLERLSQLEDESSRLIAVIFKLKVELTSKRNSSLNPSRIIDFKNNLDGFRRLFEQLLFQASSISGTFNEIDENFRISPSPDPEEIKPQLDRTRRQIRELDESFQSLSQDLKEAQQFYYRSIHSDFENSKDFLELAKQVESLHDDIKIILAVKEKRPYGVMLVQWAGQAARFIWSLARSWWRGELPNWAASYRNISKQERRKRVEATLRHIQEMLLEYQDQGIFQIEDYDQPNFVVDSVKRDFIRTILRIPFPLLRALRGKFLQPIYDFDFSFLLARASKKQEAVPRSELRNESGGSEKRKDKSEEETTSIIEFSFEPEFDKFISEAFALGANPGFNFQQIQDFLANFLHWKRLVLKFAYNRALYDKIFTPLREAALERAWQKIISNRLIPLLQSGEIKSSMAFYKNLKMGDLIFPAQALEFLNTPDVTRQKNATFYIFNEIDRMNQGVNLTIGLVSSFIHMPFERFQKNYAVLVPAPRSEIRQPRGAIEHILDRLIIYNRIFRRTSRKRIREKMVKKVARLWALRHKGMSFSGTHEAEDDAFLSVLNDAFGIAVLQELNRAKYTIRNRPISLAEDFKVHLLDLPEKYHPDPTKYPLDLLLARQLSAEMIEEGLKGRPVNVQIPEFWVHGTENYHSSIKKILQTVLKQKHYELGKDYDLDIQTLPGVIPSQTSWSPARRSAGSRVTITFKGLHRAGQNRIFEVSRPQRSELRRKGIRGVVLKITDGIIPLAVTLYGTEEEIDSLIEEFLKSVPAAGLQSSVQNLRAEKFQSAGQILALQGDVIMLGPELIKQGGLAFAGTVFGEKPVIAIALTEDVVKFIEDFNHSAARIKKIRFARNIQEAVQLLRETGKQPLRTQAYISSAESLDLAQALEKQLGDPNITRITPKMFEQTIERAELRDLVTDLRTRYQRLAQSA